MPLYKVGVNAVSRCTGYGTHFDMMSSSLSSQVGLGSALRNASTDSKSANSTNTEPYPQPLITTRYIPHHVNETHLELLRAVYAPHPHGISLAIHVEEVLQLLLQARVFRTKTFL